jgi:hypothetical protein
MPSLAEAIQVAPKLRNSVAAAQSFKSVEGSIIDWLSKNKHGFTVKHQEYGGNLHLILANEESPRLSDEQRAKAACLVEMLKEKHDDINVSVPRNDGIYFHCKCALGTAV